MKKVMSILVLALVANFGYSQEFQGLIVYESKTNVADFKARLSENKEITPETQKIIEERMKKNSEKTFMLYFDKTASIYEEETKLDTPGTQGGGGMRMMASFSGAGGKMFKNTKEKNYTINKEMMGKEFLIKDTLTNYKWKMETETKKIGNYTCFKATCEVKISKTDFRNMRLKKKEDGEKKEDKKEKSTNFMDQMDLPKTMQVTAWYSPEIPINQGPEGYWGLPGMILEITAGKTTILCSKVVMNLKDKIEIKPSTKGEVVTQTKYDEIITKKMEEMREMFQNQGSRGGQGGFKIRN